MSQLELINMGEVARQEVDWLYYPYLPFGPVVCRILGGRTV